MPNTTAHRDTAASLSVALDYLHRGLSVIPLPPGRKHPPRVEWKGYQSRLPTVAEVTRWWTQWPASGIAIVTGRVSGVVVLDVDPRRDGHLWARNLVVHWTPGPIALSGTGGPHYYFAADPARPLGTHTDLFQGIDLKGDGGYVVAPPSRHPNGQSYRWVTPLGARPLPPVPPDIYHAVIVRTGDRLEAIGPRGTVTHAAFDLDIDTALAALDGVRLVHAGWVARCPAHDDHHPSLSVGTGRGGRLLLHCFAGCTFPDVLHALQVRRAAEVIR